MIVYADVLVVVNFLITYFLLMAASVLTGYTYSRKRIFISSLAGGFFCLYIFVQHENIFVDLLIKIFSAVTCAVIAFGKTNIKKFAVQTICFVMLNMLITGVMISLSVQNSMIFHNNMFFYININPVVMVVVTVIIYIIVVIISSIKEKISPQKTYKAEIFFERFVITEINAFYDSGFRIKDIISNKDIMLVSIDKISEKIPIETKTDIYNFLEGKYKDIKTAFVPVFFNTITDGGIIPALKAKKIIIEGVKIENVLIGFVKNKLSENVTAIFGTDIKRQL